MSQVSMLSRYKILAYGESTQLLYHKGKLFLSDSRKNVKQIAILQNTVSRRFLTSIRLTERLLRMEPRIACSVNERDFLVSCSGKIYYIDTASGSVKEELQLRTRMKNPLSFAKVIHEGKEVILFGEYFSNNAHEEVCIYARENEKWTVVFRFEPGEIYHVHGIVPDSKNNRIYILTGDSDNESAIWMTENWFKTVTPLVRGSQMYRSCVAYPDGESLIYATDTAREPNGLYRLFKTPTGWTIQKLYDMPGPCIYGTVRHDACYFATSVEGDDTLSPYRYRFTYKLGKGVCDRSTHVIKHTPQGKIIEVASFRKDWLPMLAFQFGNCQFPSTALNAPLIITPVSVRKYDGKTVLIDENGD